MKTSEEQFGHMINKLSLTKKPFFLLWPLARTIQSANKITLQYSLSRPSKKKFEALNAIS